MKGYENSKIPRLYELMEERGIKAKDITEATGISSGNIADWKSGRSMPKAQSLSLLADFFNVTTDYLVGIEEQKTDNEPWETRFDFDPDDLSAQMKYTRKGPRALRGKPNNLARGKITIKPAARNSVELAKIMLQNQDRLIESISKAKTLDPEKQENVINFINYLCYLQENSKREAEGELPEPDKV